ncbi:hypothetical protein EV702DRAFT_1195878 [Suillus placidus]|uniref:F-box domain-containing protein n=1 Tax=Suillus placidus TaxID=48579 RepID=A0A9P6ZYQ2_9AGAM|nr:hypothetical protein EV702DRAFT_1195878 [Suillus placidus]
MSYPEPPIYRLPVELLQVVFLFIINDVPDYPSIFSFGETTISGNFACPPLLFTRVCRLWRAVAHSTTGIWSHIKVGLPRQFQLKPFLPSLLQSWLARSGSQPLIIRMERVSPTDNGHFCSSNTQLLEILFSEMTRWETVFGISDVFERSENFNTPQLRTLECSWPSDVTRFNAPHLCRIRFVSPLSAVIRSRPTATCKHICHLYLQNATAAVIHSSSAFFPHLETLVVGHIAPEMGSRSHPATYSRLESMTIPLFYHRYHRDPFIELFRELRLPMLQKLNVLGDPDTPEVQSIMTALALAGSCNIQVVDFRPCLWPSARRTNVYIHDVEPLLSVAREVAVCGEVVACRALATT